MHQATQMHILGVSRLQDGKFISLFLSLFFLLSFSLSISSKRSSLFIFTYLQYPFHPALPPYSNGGGGEEELDTIFAG